MSEPPDRPVGLILDTTAILAFTDPKLAIHVGEPLTEAEDNGELLGLPLPCLVEAARTTTSGLLDLLVGSDSVVVLAEDPASWRALASMWELVGRPGAATAALFGLDLDVLVLTREPGRYRSVRDGELAIAIPGSDASDT